MIVFEISIFENNQRENWIENHSSVETFSIQAFTLKLVEITITSGKKPELNECLSYNKV